MRQPSRLCHSLHSVLVSNLALFDYPSEAVSSEGLPILMHAYVNIQVLNRTCILRLMQYDAVNSVIRRVS